ncbi:26 proteasome complex subunit DSS1, partial [Tremellales sp. Uapishka_1]
MSDQTKSMAAAKPTEATVPAVVPEKKKLPQLGALEDDDEFEDFPPSGTYPVLMITPCMADDGEIAAEQSGNVLEALGKTGDSKDHLWEDNWDDDDIEDDFLKQLRTAINERNGGDETMKE